MCERQIIHRYGYHKQGYSQARPAFEMLAVNPMDGVSFDWLVMVRYGRAEPKTGSALRLARRRLPQDRPPAANLHRQAKLPSRRMIPPYQCQNRPYTTALSEPVPHHPNAHSEFAIRAYRFPQAPPQPRPNTMLPTRNHSPIAQS